MKIDVITVFPEMFRGFFGESILKRAAAMGVASIRTVDLRDFATDRRRTVDDKPYSGGPGMLMKPDVWFQAIESCLGDRSVPARVVMMTPTGRPYTQRVAEEFSAAEHLIILCGHYEGIDQRVIDEIVDEEISIGDYVVTGGELPAMILADAVSRMLPGVLADEQGFIGESHYSSLLEHPQYTKPSVWHERVVPEVLSSGHHAKIEEWKREQSLERTFLRRPELLEKAELSENDKKILSKIRENHSMK